MYDQTIEQTSNWLNENLQEDEVRLVFLTWVFITAITDKENNKYHPINFNKPNSDRNLNLVTF